MSRRFLAARAFHNRTANDPERCDLAHLHAFDADGMDPAALAGLVAPGRAAGRWVIVGGHEVGTGGDLSITPEALEAVCRAARDAGAWIAPVAEVAAHLAAARQGAATG